MNRLIPLMLILGCARTGNGPPGEPDSAIIVGSPGKGMTTAPSDGYAFRTSSWSADLTLWPCVDTESPVLLAGVSTDAPLGIPAGSWCRASFTEGSALVVEADGPEGPLSIDIPLPSIELDAGGPWVVDADEPSDEASWLLELGGPNWLASVELDGTTVFDERNPGWGELVTTLRQGTALYGDEDADGVVGAEERSRPALSATAAVAPAELLSVTEAGPYLWTSADGGDSWQRSWVANGVGDDLELVDTARAGDLFVAVGSQGDRRVVARSVDGVQWYATALDGAPFTGITSDGTRLVAVDTAGIASWSEDGIAWTDVDTTVGLPWLDVAWGGGFFYAAGESGARGWSTDGVSWSVVSDDSVTNYHLTDIEWCGDHFVIGGRRGRRVILENDGGVGEDSADNSDDFRAVTWAGDHVVASRGNRLWTAPSGYAWDESIGLLVTGLASDEISVWAIQRGNSLVVTSDARANPVEWTSLEPTADALTSVTYLAR